MNQLQARAFLTKVAASHILRVRQLAGIRKPFYKEGSSRTPAGDSVSDFRAKQAKYFNMSYTMGSEEPIDQNWKGYGVMYDLGMRLSRSKNPRTQRYGAGDVRNSVRYMADSFMKRAPRTGGTPVDILTGMKLDTSTPFGQAVLKEISTRMNGATTMRDYYGQRRANQVGGSYVRPGSIIDSGAPRRQLYQPTMAWNNESGYDLGDLSANGYQAAKDEWHNLQEFWNRVPQDQKARLQSQYNLRARQLQAYGRRYNNSMRSAQQQATLANSPLPGANTAANVDRMFAPVSNPSAMAMNGAYNPESFAPRQQIAPYTPVTPVTNPNLPAGGEGVAMSARSQPATGMSSARFATPHYKSTMAWDNKNGYNLGNPTSRSAFNNAAREYNSLTNYWKGLTDAQRANKQNLAGYERRRKQLVDFGNAYNAYSKNGTQPQTPTNT